LHSHTERYFGGDLFAKHHSIVVGGLCRPGYERSRSTSTSPNPVIRWNSSSGSTGGNCNFESWLAPDDPFDCRANIHAFTEALGGQVTCYVDVYEERSARTCTDTRFGDRCGGVSADRSCFCDPQCESFGDCCPDFIRICSSTP
jgi:hypothetical protein